MKNVFLAALMAAAAGPVIAQTMAPPPAAPMAMPPREAKSITRAEMIQRVTALFQRADTNHDGVVTQDELAAMGEGGGGQWKHGQDGAWTKRTEGPMGDPNAMFDRLDTNHDGSLSRAEFAAGREVRIEQRKIVMNATPGQPVPPDPPMGGDMRMRHGGGGMGMGAGMLRMADLNHDGRITLQEAQAAASQHFDMMDANHDGTVTPDERKAGRGHMMPMDMKRGN